MDFLTKIQLDEIGVLKNVIDVCRDILSSSENLPLEKRQDALEELRDGVEMYNRLIENLKQ
ncbi:hypothetical protein EBU71_06310 [bacterium]|jgi:hypothetical protein|nr:hypothetical protein [Candidatus Elulimicrobium humile]